MTSNLALRVASFSQRWAALNEVSAAVAAAIGLGALDCQPDTPAYRRAVHSLKLSMAWITNIIVIALWLRQT